MRVGYMGYMESPNARAWIDEMYRRGVEPVALTLERPSWDIEWAQIVVRQPPVKGIGLGRLMLGREIARLCRRYGVQLLHNHEADRFAFWARYSGFHPRLITCWGSDVLRLRTQTSAYRMGLRLSLRSADAITAGSHSLLEAAVAAGARRDRCVLVGWGVDTRRFRPDDAARARIRAEWGLENRDIVLSTRLHKPLYRVDMILQGFAEARKQTPDLALVVAGWGSETESLVALAHELGVTDDVRFVGRVDSGTWPDMPAIYAGADVFCSIPETDGGPLSVLEAMACELPVVVSDVPVMREWVEDGKNGFVWADGTVHELAKELILALENREAVGSAAREYVVEHHERSREMDKVHELYRSLVAAGERRR